MQMFVVCRLSPVNCRLHNNRRSQKNSQCGKASPDYQSTLMWQSQSYSPNVAKPQSLTTCQLQCGKAPVLLSQCGKAPVLLIQGPSAVVCTIIDGPNALFMEFEPQIEPNECLITGNGETGKWNFKTLPMKNIANEKYCKWQHNHELVSKRQHKHVSKWSVSWNCLFFFFLFFLLFFTNVSTKNELVSKRQHKHDLVSKRQQKHFSKWQHKHTKVKKYNCRMSWRLSWTWSANDSTNMSATAANI